MEQDKFRKLNIDFPLEKITNERPWFIAGSLIAIAFLFAIIYAFLRNRGMF